MKLEAEQGGRYDQKRTRKQNRKVRAICISSA
jgi:hypothetical protein